MPEQSSGISKTAVLFSDLGGRGWQKTIPSEAQAPFLFGPGEDLFLSARGKEKGGRILQCTLHRQIRTTSGSQRELLWVDLFLILANISTCRFLYSRKTR